MIEIGLCADENFAMPCGVCITSIFESNKDSKIRVHILTDGFSDESVKRFNKTAERYKQTIEIHTINSSLLDGVPTRENLPIMAYARLLFAKTLDTNLEKILYLDCDVIVLDSIKELWNNDISEYACACAIDQLAHDIRTYNRLGIYDFNYINSGLILMNLNNWRDTDIGAMCIKYALRNPEKCVWLDQDAINSLLYRDIKYLHPKYNFSTPLFSTDFKDLWINAQWWPMLKEAKESPVILHFIAPVKPWHKEYKLKEKKFFVDMLKISEWSDYKIRYKAKGKSLLKYHLRNIYKGYNQLLGKIIR